MESLAGSESSREIIKDKLRQNFDGKIVRKDLTKKIKEGANVPVYVLEFLLGQYCSSDDEEVIEIRSADCQAYSGRQLCASGRSTKNSVHLASAGPVTLSLTK
jgi:predicted ATP-dependent Lon-type protease